MAGHSKWSKIKRLKVNQDVKRGKLFSKISKEITVAAKLASGNSLFNPRLKSAMQAARTKGMPNENIERALKKGARAVVSTTTSTVTTVEEVLYEGYGAGRVALIVEASTKNKHRTAADLRSIFSKNRGTLDGPGSVAYLFQRKGKILVSKNALQEEWLLEVALNAGAEDLIADDDYFSLLTSPKQFYLVAEFLKTSEVHILSQQLTFIPRKTVHINDLQTASNILQLCDALEDYDDVLCVHSNSDISEGLLARMHPN